MPRAPAPARLLELVDAMAGRPVLVLGDLVVDRFVTGTPKRISREAPVLILSFSDESLVPGGGANAVANLASLGGRPLPIGVVGDDSSGHGLLAALQERGVDTSGIVVRAGYRTPTKTRILAGGRHSIKQQIVRYDVEDSLPPDPDLRRQLVERVAHQAGRAEIAILSDYGYGTAPPELVGDLRAAVGASGLLLCDSRYRLTSFAGLDGATPNEEEAEAQLGQTLGDDPATLRAGGQSLLNRLSGQFLLVTRGSLGMSLFRPDGCAHLPVHGTDQVADVTGAGDTVIATFALALAAGGTPIEAAALANYAGGVVVMKLGTATLDRDELRQAIVTDDRPLKEMRWEAY